MTPSHSHQGQTLRHSFEAVARGRFLMPVVLALGVGVMTINESTYQHSFRTLTVGIALTDARVQAAETLQLLTDAGLYARSYILSESPDDAVEYRAAVKRMHEVKQKAFDLVAEVDPQRQVSVDAVEQLVNEHIRSTDEWVTLVAQGEARAALAAAVSRALAQRVHPGS
jgi:CHASE3 domain sensor protein